MNEERVTTRTTLLEHIERDWLAINALLDSIRPEQWVDVRNGDGWAIKDHVAHLSAWEGVVIALLQGNLPYVALGVSEAVYRDADYDRINNVVFERHRADKVESVRQRFHEAHTELIRLIRIVSDEDLQKSVDRYVTDASEWPLINIIYGNTAHHYRTHQAWIEEMLAEAI